MAERKYHYGRVTYRKRGGKWHCYYTDPRVGKQVFKRLDATSEAVARQKAKEISDALEGGQLDRIDKARNHTHTTFADAVDAYLKVSTWAPSTLDRNKGRIRLLSEHFDNTPIAKITPHDIGAYLQEVTTTRSIASRNRYLAILSKVFGYAFDNALIATDPTDKLKQLKEPEKVVEALTPAQFGAVMSALPPYAQIIMGILHDTGMRAGELHSLQWRDVRLNDRRIVVRASETARTKNMEYRLIPMTEYVYNTFNELSNGTEFPQTQKGQSVATIHWPDDSEPEAVVIPPIDIKKSLIVAAKKVGLPKLTRHMMRHTFATTLG